MSTSRCSSVGQKPSTRTRAIGIHPPALALLAEAGVADEVLRRSAPIRAGVARSGGRVLGRLRFDPAIRTLPQWQTERMLRARLEQLRPGALRLVLTRAGSSSAATGCGCSAPASGHEWPTRGCRLPTRWCRRPTSGCGWPTSESMPGSWWPRTAPAAASETRQASPGARSAGRRRYLMADLPDTSRYGSTAVLSFERGGVVESFPMPGKQRRWVALTPAPVENPTCELLGTIIRERVGDTLFPGGEASAFVARQHLADRMVRGRVALAGDAAHEISPIGGQGMNLGWLDAADLARTLALALQHPESDLFAAVMLAGYDRRRRRSARMAARQAGFNMAMGQPADGMTLAARTTLMRTLAGPPTRELLARAFTMRWL